MRKPKRKFFRPNKIFAVFLVFPVVAVILFFSFRKTVTNADISAQLEVQKVENQNLTEELNNWKKLYSEVYDVKEDYRKSVQEITDLLYLKKMPVGGQSVNPPLKATDKLTIKVLRDTIASFKEVQSSFYDLKDFLLTRRTIINETPFIYPLKTSGTVKLSSAYGFRQGLFKQDSGQLKFHPGVDLVANVGDLVQATADGEVRFLETENATYGMLVVLRHELGYETWYAHLSAIKVKIGQKVKRGEIVGLVGETGETTGPHLHYEIHIGENSIDPMIFISAEP